jgi:hypothetical protein
MKFIPVIVEDDCDFNSFDIEYIYKLCRIMCNKYELQFLQLIGEQKGFIVYDNSEILEDVVKSVNSALSIKKSDYIMMLPKILVKGKGLKFSGKGNILISK